MDKESMSYNIGFSVTGRARTVHQPSGGYIKLSKFKRIALDDGIVVVNSENIHKGILGLTVDYMSRYMMGTPKEDAFKISLQGAERAEKNGIKNSEMIARILLKGINGNDEQSIICASKLVTFDVWIRNIEAARIAKNYKDTHPDSHSIYNIQCFIERTCSFLKAYGPVIKDGFTFEPIDEDIKKYYDMFDSYKGSYGGYTPVVCSGDGDFLTYDTLWDVKVIKSKPTIYHTLQLVMYWIMGVHSGQECYKTIKKLGIFNPRYNVIYLIDINDISKETITLIEKNIICY